MGTDSGSDAYKFRPVGRTSFRPRYGDPAGPASTLSPLKAATIPDLSFYAQVTSTF